MADISEPFFFGKWRTDADADTDNRGCHRKSEAVSGQLIYRKERAEKALCPFAEPPHLVRSAIGFGRQPAASDSDH